MQTFDFDNVPHPREQTLIQYRIRNGVFRMLSNGGKDVVGGKDGFGGAGVFGTMPLIFGFGNLGTDV